MSVARTIANDWRYSELTEDVTYTQQPEGVADLIKAHREDLSHREVQLGGPVGIESTDIVWVLWSATLTTTPTEGDLITDSRGAVWTILSTTETSIGTTSITWRCVCRKQVTR